MLGCFPQLPDEAAETSSPTADTAELDVAVDTTLLPAPDANGSVCSATTVGAPCNDGNACTEADRCTEAGLCVGAARTCDDDNPCTVDVCDAARGCVFTALVGASCDDGDPCTERDACDDVGRCTGEARICDDDNPCTDDRCEAGACLHTVVVARACDDGDACTSDDRCDAAGTCAGEVIVCDDDNPCTADACDPDGGACTFTPLVGDACDDGDLCTEGDACDATGACIGVPLPCDDGDPCTIDTCWPGSGQCVSRPIGVQVTKDFLGWPLEGEYTWADVVFDGPYPGFRAVARTTRLNDNRPDTSFAVFGLGLLTNVPSNVVVGLDSPEGGSHRLNDAIVSEHVAIGVGGQEEANVWTGVVTVHLLGTPAGETLRLPETGELMSVIRSATGFIAVGKRVPSPAEPEGIAVVRLTDFGAIASTHGLGEPADTAIYVTRSTSEPIIVGHRVDGTPLLIRLDVNGDQSAKPGCAEEAHRVRVQLEVMSWLDDGFGTGRMPGRAWWRRSRAG